MQKHITYISQLIPKYNIKLKPHMLIKQKKR